MSLLPPAMQLTDEPVYLGALVRPKAPTPLPPQDDWACSTPRDGAPRLPPEGVIEAGPNIFEARCCVCGEWFEIDYVDDLPDEEIEHWCGRDQRCCP